jgi:hypothetical protein
MRLIDTYAVVDPLIPPLPFWMYADFMDHSFGLFSRFILSFVLLVLYVVEPGYLSLMNMLS